MIYRSARLFLILLQLEVGLRVFGLTAGFARTLKLGELTGDPSTPSMPTD